MKLIRFGISIPQKLSRQFDEYLKKKIIPADLKQYAISFGKHSFRKKSSKM